MQISTATIFHLEIHEKNCFGGNYKISYNNKYLVTSSQNLDWTNKPSHHDNQNDHVSESSQRSVLQQVAWGLFTKLFVPFVGNWRDIFEWRKIESDDSAAAQPDEGERKI